MQKINFQDLPSTETPIKATNLNLLQTNVENAINLKADSTTLTNYINGTTSMGSIKTTGVSINDNAVNNVAFLEYEVVDTW